MAHRVIALLFVIVLAPWRAEPTAQTRAEWAVAPLPEHLRDGAAVWEFRDGRAVEVRPGTNGFVCTGDRPGNAVYAVECVSPGYARYLSRQRALEAEGLSRAEVLKALDAEIAAGALRIEAGATKMTLQGALGPDGVVADPLRWDLEAYVPDATTASTGLPDDTLDRFGFTLMGGGTPQSHIHIRRSVTKAEVFGGR